MGYFNKTVKGVSWVGAFRITTRGVSFLRTIILARILAPAQFGVFGIATLAVVFLEIMTETGINVFLIQKKQSLEKYINTAWVVSIFRGVLIFLFLLVAAGPISTFFNSPDARSAILLISLVALIRGFINPSIVSFQKELKFKNEFWFKFVIFSFDSAVAIIVSLLTKSATGMVLGLIAGATLELIMSFTFVRPRPRFEFSAGKLREVVSTGKWLTGAGIFQLLFRQGDDAVVGKLLGESRLGIYQVAYKISTLPISEITDVVGRVTFPVYVKISSDMRRLRRAFIKTTVAITILAIASGIFLFIFGEFMVNLFLGERWLEVVPLLKILVVFGVIQSIANSTNSLLLARKMQKYVTISNFVNVLGMGITIIPLTYAFGLQGSAVAPIIGSLLGLPLSLIFVRKSLRQ